jgi:DNA-binding FadR family transcriptional regulator
VRKIHPASILAEYEQINLEIQNRTAEAAEHARRAHLEAALIRPASHQSGRFAANGLMPLCPPFQA